MGYRFLDHTADVAVELAAPTLAGLYAEAAAAFTDTITERERVEERASRRFELAAEDAERLLVEWLGELLYVFEVDGLLVARAEVEVERRDEGLRLAAEAFGEPLDHDRHPVKVLVKAITFHGLQVSETAGSFAARLVFDI